MKNTIKKILLIYVIIWLVIVVAFWLGLKLEPMLFSIAAFYVALPLTAFIVSLYLGRQETHLKWLFIPFSGLMQFLAPFLTFSLANMFAFNKGLDQVVLPDLYSSFFSIIPAFIGMIISIRHMHKKAKNEENEEN